MGLAVVATGFFWYRQVPPLYAGFSWRDLAVPRAELLSRDLTTYGEALKWLSDRGTRRSLAVGQFVTYRAPGRVFINGTVGETPILWRAFRDSGSLPEARKKLRQFGVSSIWYNFVSAKVIRTYYSGSFEWDDRMTAAYEGFLRRYATVAYRSSYCDHVNGGYYIHPLRDRPGAPEPGALDYLPGTENLMGRAVLLGSEGRNPEALAEMERVARKWPELRFLRNELGYLYAQRGEWKKAYDALKPLIASPMMDSTLRPAFGTAAMGLDRIDEAQPILEASLRMHPSSAREIRLNLAAIASRRGLGYAYGNRFVEAKEAIAKAAAYLDFSPEGLPPASVYDWRSKAAGVKGLMADVAAAEHRFTDARILYEEAYRIGPDIPGAENWKARIGEMREMEGREQK
jgi:tetratricopeptide (TPR) repeat protein